MECELSRCCRFALMIAALASPSLTIGPISLCDTIYVPGDHPTIQKAINASSNGDEIVVADDTYTGGGNTSLNFGGRLITLRSASGDPGLCIIDCVFR